MKYIVLISSFFLLSLTNPKEDKVFICEGKYATKYHLKEDCRGLSNCKADVIEITLKEAKENKRTLCGWED